MLADIEAGLVGTVIVKDMSRLGRNYLQVGMYTEMIFPQKNVRFIAINDGVDSAQGDNDFAPLRNIFNEWLVRDTSKKIRAVKRSKGMSGKPVTSKPVYGYLMDEDENFIIDEEAAPVVKQIYSLCLAGNGPTKIARMLTEQQTPTPGTLEYRRTGSNSACSLILMHYPNVIGIRYPEQANPEFDEMIEFDEDDLFEGYRRNLKKIPF